MKVLLYLVSFLDRAVSLWATFLSIKHEPPLVNSLTQTSVLNLRLVLTFLVDFPCISFYSGSYLTLSYSNPCKLRHTGLKLL